MELWVHLMALFAVCAVRITTAPVDVYDDVDPVAENDPTFMDTKYFGNDSMTDVIQVIHNDPAAKAWTDENRLCPGWASRGESKKNPNFMLVYCRKSCKICGGGDSD